MPERIEAVARGVAGGMRADARLDYTFSYPVTRNDAEAANRVLGVAGDLFGEESVLGLANPSMGARLRLLLEKVPGAFVWLGVGRDVSGLHTPQFAFDEGILPRGSALLAALALNELAA
jgi:metal-dependent amidase/aminoacylase/carboxypeptidase family protein